jgi:hypothetical protein
MCSILFDRFQVDIGRRATRDIFFNKRKVAFVGQDTYPLGRHPVGYAFEGLAYQALLANYVMELFRLVWCGKRANLIPSPPP